MEGEFFFSLHPRVRFPAQLSTLTLYIAPPPQLPSTIPHFKEKISVYSLKRPLSSLYSSPPTPTPWSSFSRLFYTTRRMYQLERKITGRLAVGRSRYPQHTNAHGKISFFLADAKRRISYLVYIHKSSIYRPSKILLHNPKERIMLVITKLFGQYNFIAN